MSKWMWSGVILMIIALTLIVLDATVWAGGVEVLGANPAGTWEPARALDTSKDGKTVKVQVLAGPAGEQELVYAMPELVGVKKEMELPMTAEGRMEKVEGTVLVLGNAPVTGAPGKPVLPVVPCYIALPAGEEFAGASVVCGGKVTLPGTHVIAHGQKAIALMPDAKPEYTVPDPAVYGSDDPWPGVTHEVVTVQKRRGVTIVVINLNPVEYKPKSGQISCWTGMKLSVATKQAVTTGKSEYRPDPARPVTKQVDNPAVITTYGQK